MTEASPSQPPLPTDAELGILRVLWAHGSRTVREIHEVLARERPIGYTSVLKVLQVMHGKGLVERDESNRSHSYRAVLAEEETQRRLVADLAQKAFGGSRALLAVRALSQERASAREIEQILGLLRDADTGEQAP